MQNLTKERKQPPVVILQKSIFYNIFIRCLWLRIIRRSDYGVQFMNFPSKIFFNDINHGYRAAILKKSSLWLLPFYMAVATYCYYKKVHRTMRTAIVSYLLKFAYGNYISITANGNILASGNLSFRVFNLQLKVINKNLCYLYNV